MICIGVAILSGVGIYLVNGKIEETQTLLTQKSAEAERLAANVRDGAQLPEQVNALTAAGAKIQARMIKASQLANNLQYFYRLENESGVELLDVRQTTSGTKNAAGGVGFAVSVKGDYPTLLGYLRRLEGGPNYCRIVSTSIAAPTPDRSGLLTLSLNLELLGQP
ncbi:MAG: hypothetical protein ABIV50_15350 [Opitutus sp.]